VLTLVVGTLVGVAIPMLMAIISIIVALGVAALIGQAFELNLFILNMIVAMGLALGIDYSRSSSPGSAKSATAAPVRATRSSPCRTRPPERSCSAGPRSCWR
jgi:hypothetical protein